MARYPNMPGRYTTYAAFLEADGKIEDAERILKEWVRLDPKSADRHAYIAEHYRGRGQGLLARTHYDTAIRLQPDHYQSLVIRGFLYEEERQFDKAIDLYERIVERLHPAVPVAKQASERIEFLRTSR
jgi:tetratricopeptide (TPR) repeat protein